nr:MAG TPA: hypothetical protein [Caudoviricetes sp.]
MKAVAWNFFVDLLYIILVSCSPGEIRGGMGSNPIQLIF